MEAKGLKFLLIPEDALSEVRSVLSLSGEQLAKLESALSDRETLREDKRTYRRIAELLDVSPDTAIGILTAVENVRRQRERYNISDEALVQDLEVLSQHKLDARDALLSLLKRSEGDYFVEKVTSLRHSLVPHMTEARTVVDARPVFSQDRDQIEGFLVVTFLEIATHDPRDDESGTVVMQLSRKQITKLKQTLEDAEKKLGKMVERLGVLDVYE